MRIIVIMSVVLPAVVMIGAIPLPVHGTHWMPDDGLRRVFSSPFRNRSQKMIVAAAGNETDFEDSGFETIEVSNSAVVTSKETTIGNDDSLEILVFDFKGEQHPATSAPVFKRSNHG